MKHKDFVKQINQEKRKLSMYTIDEVIEIVMNEDCNDLTIGDCFDEEEIIEVINDLTDSNVIGDNDSYDESLYFYDDGDIDIIIDNLN